MSGQRTIARAPKGPANAHVVAAVALLVVFALLLLTAPRTAPPAIAEIAPVAAQQITEPPPEQASKFGQGEGVGDATLSGGDGDGDGLPDETDDPNADPNEPDEGPRPPRHRKCIGTPPRQTEDPQSPPCVDRWEGDNGGGTAPGVTGSEIFVAVPAFIPSATPQLIDYFNRRFQFYGRKIVMVRVSDPGQGDPTNLNDGGCYASAQEQIAAEALQKNVFASLYYLYCGGALYGQRLAEKGRIYVGIEPVFSEPFMKRHAPYLWQYPKSLDRILTNSGEWACSRFANAAASFTNSADIRGDRRRFGVVFQRQHGQSRDIKVDDLLRVLRNCTDHEPYFYEYDPATAQTGDTQYLDIVLGLKDAGATTVFCLCDYVIIGDLGRMATSQQYFPEWLVNSYIALDQNNWLTFAPAREHLANTLGLSFLPRQNPPALEPSTWALQEVCPACGTTASEQGGSFQISLKYLYRSLLLLSSGIQMAGPELTAANFQGGLQRAQFPNPEHEIMPGKVGFGGGSHSMTLDAVEWWFDNQAESPYFGDPPGAVCYLAGGQRVRDFSTLTPNGGGFQQPPCDSGA